MKEEKRRRIFRTCLSVKDREPIYLYCPIGSRVLHSTFPSKNLRRQLRCYGEEGDAVPQTRKRWE